MGLLESNLTRRELLIGGATVAAAAASGAAVQAATSSSAISSGSGNGRFAVSIAPSTGIRVQPRIFGGDVEPIARVTYDGIWDRQRNIPRADVKAAIAALGTTAIRWPGSSAASAYHWRDGVGPLEKRPVYEQTFWTPYAERLIDGAGIKGEEKAALLRRVDPGEPNQFGTDEFLQYCLDLGIEPVLSANIGGGQSNGTPGEASAWVRYCNVDRKSPRPVQWWQLGNEVWSVGDRDHQPPKDYANRVVALAAAMRREDPTIKVICVATGVHGADFTRDVSRAFPNLESWNRDVFSISGPHVNAASFTWYFPGSIGRVLRDTEADALQMATASDLFGSGLDRVITDLNAAGAAHVPLYLGEWGRQTKFPEILFNDNQKLYDGVFFAGCFNKMLARAPRVLGAHLSTLINQTALIQTVGDRLFVTAGYLVSQLYRRSCRSELAAVKVKSDTMIVPAMQDTEKAGYLVEGARTDRRAAILDAAATADAAGTTVYLTNRSMSEAITVNLSGIKPFDGRATYRYVTGESPYSWNTIDAPGTLRIAEIPVDVKGGRAVVTVPACTAGALIVGPIAGALVSI